MRILVISDHADPLAEIGSKECGGQNIYVYYLANFLAKFDIYVDVFTRWDRKNKKEVVEINKHMRVIRVKAGPKSYMPRDNFFHVLDEFTSNILKHVHREKITYDVIHTNYLFSGISGIEIAKRLKKPQVHIYHSIGQIRFNTLKKFKLQQKDYIYFQKRLKMEKEIAQKSNAVISSSPVEKQLIERLFDVPGEKIKYIPIGIDKKVFKPLDMFQARKTLRMSEKKKIVLYVGRIEWRKGLGTLLHSVSDLRKKYSNIHLYIIGGGRSKTARSLEGAEHQRQLRIMNRLNLKDNVSFLGPKTQKNLHKYYSAADVCVVPSYYEPFGIVPLESMACGTPVVASRTGGLQYTVKHGVTGYTVKPRDHNDLTLHIDKVLQKGKNYFTPKCLERIDELFIWDCIAGQYISFFEQITS